MNPLPGLTEPIGLTLGIAAISFAVGSVVLGWLVQRLVIGRVRAGELGTPDGFKAVLGGALHGVVVVLFTLLGIFVAVAILPVDPEVERGLGSFLLILLIASLTFVTARAIGDSIQRYARRKEQSTRSSSIFVNFARIIVVSIGLLVLLQTFGVSITPILAALGVGGLAVALALQDTLANFFAGLQLIATKKVKPGDYVHLDSGEEGYVVDIDWRHTSVRKLQNNMVLVPNSKMVNNTVTNFYYPDKEMAILVEVGVGYESDLRHVERVTIEVARQTLKEAPGGVANFDPFIRLHTFNDFSIDMTVILRVQEFTDQFLVKHEFVKRLHERYREEGIVIPFPIRTVDWPEARQVFGDGVKGADAEASRRE